MLVNSGRPTRLASVHMKEAASRDSLYWAVTCIRCCRAGLRRDSASFAASAGRFAATLALARRPSFVQFNHFKETVMDRNRVEGAAKQVKGSVRETIGKVTGNRTTQASGAAEKLTGKVQSKVGKFADAVRARVKW
jgi:uncharacterized protein YjbJ (UPF0337 family)